MTKMKRMKSVRQRGGKTHGWGAKKKHRGAGNRGGRGNAGSGKRADQKKPSFWDNRAPQRNSQKRGQDYFGKYGFGMNAGKKLSTITVRDLDTRLPQLVAEKKATEKGGAYTIDLTAAGFGKLLGTGQATKKVTVTVVVATASAIEKITAAGGSVETTGVLKTKEAPSDKKKAE